MAAVLPLAVGALLLAVAPTASAAPLAGLARSTGGDSSLVTQPALTSAEQRQFAAKVRTASAILESIGRTRAQRTTDPDNCSPAPCPPNHGVGSLPHPLFYEGQGDGGAWWTCGPSATRTLIAGITGVDYGEHQFALREHDTAEGKATPIGNIVSTLNAKFGPMGAYGDWGTWKDKAPSGPDELQAWVAADVSTSDRQSAILNVATVYLPFWHGTADGHYNLGYAYNLAQQTVGIADEWNHSVDGQGDTPFGFHPGIDDSIAYEAVHSSASHEIVW